MAKEIKCPLDCEQKFKGGTKTTKGDIQHHLYMRHKMDVIEAHKLAERLIEGAQ